MILGENQSPKNPRLGRPWGKIPVPPLCTLRAIDPEQSQMFGGSPGNKRTVGDTLEARQAARFPKNLGGAPPGFGEGRKEFSLAPPLPPSSAPAGPFLIPSEMKDEFAPSSGAPSSRD